MAAKDRLGEIAAQLRQAKEFPPITVRDLLSWFDAQRRGYWIVEMIRRDLDTAGLATDPDFESAYIDSPLRFQLVRASEPDYVSGAEPTASTGPTNAASGAPTLMMPAVSDPTYRISKLEAANKPPTSVKPDATIQEAVTVMLANNFSQLPVMTSEREVKGVVSWTSIGTRLALGKNGEYARDLMDGHHEIRADSSLFDAISTIVKHQYVLVRGGDNRIVGIVTASDLSSQFQTLAEPFLLLGEIENHIRHFLGRRLSPEDFAEVKDPGDEGRKVAGVVDLNFGEYVRLLENRDRWRKVGIPIDRATFCSELDRVRAVRNDVMHFDPDGIPPDDLTRLRDFARFLQRLQFVGVP
jgi:CBS domain-containing protein